jgi:sialic acid synthase SpsE
LFFKRSIYVAEDIKEGDVFTEKKLKVIRPGDGLAPKYYNQLIGKIASKKYKKGRPFSL